MGEREAVLAQAKQQMAEQAKWEAQQQAQLEKWDADLTCRQAALRERGDALNQQQARLQAERNVLEQQQAQQQTQLEKWVADLACREAELNARDQQQARLQAQLDQRETQLTDGVMSVAKQKVALESPAPSESETAYSAAYHVQSGMTETRFSEVFAGIQRISGLPPDRFVKAAEGCR